MRARTGQATIEAIVVLVVVIALVGALAANGAFAWLPRVLARTTTVLAPDRAASPTSADLAFLDHAIARDRDADGPMLRDALLRLAQTVGPTAARAIAIDHLLRQYAPLPARRLRALGDPSFALARPAFSGVGPGTSELWSQEEPRAPTAVRIVTADDERHWRGSQRATIATRAVELGVSGAIALAGAVSPATTPVSIGLGAAAAAMDVTSIAIPSGSREDDVLLCRFVWRRNHAQPQWIASHPADALRLALEQRVPAVELTVIRGGGILTRDVVRSHATTC
ncbi:MAG: hypothetical protein ACR2J9_06830 [Gaiellales bacterium]